MFELAANRFPRNKCLGWRPYDSVRQTWGNFEWMDYATVQRRRANFGVGIVSVNKDNGVNDQTYGVGLWCQNRPEWQITGMIFCSRTIFQCLWIHFRSCVHVTITVHSLALRYFRTIDHGIHHQSCLFTMYCDIAASYSDPSQVET